MAKFEFQLEGVLKHRKNIEHERQRALAVVQAQMNDLQRQLRLLDDDVKQAGLELRQKHLVGVIDLNYLAAHRRFAGAMQRKGMALVQKMAILQRQLDEARGHLAEAAKQRKIIEKLREKQLARWQETIARAEAAQQDEIGMQLAYRQISAQNAASEIVGVEL
jgi:flagellar FliJ protein